MTGIVPLAIDLGTREITAAHTALAIALLGGLFILLAIARYQMQFVGLSDEQQREKEHLLGQRKDQDPETLRIPASDVESLHSYREKVRALWSSDVEPPGMREQKLVRNALRQAYGELVAAWRDRTDHLPRLALTLGELAVAVAITGGIATTSAETFRRIFAASSDGITLDQVVAVATSTGRDAVAVSIDALGAFPFADTLWALFFAYGILGMQWLYEHPFVSAAVLALATIAVVVLDRRAPDAVDAKLVGSRSSVAVRSLAALTVIWLTGVLWASVGQIIGMPTLGVYVGFGFAVCFAIAFTYLGVSVLRDRIRTVSSDLSGENHVTAAYLVLRRVGAGYAGLVAPLVPVYVVVAIASGKLSAILDAYSGGSTEMQVVVGALILLAVGLVARQARDAYPELKAAVAEQFARQSIRAALFRQGVPYIVVVLGYFLAIGFGLPAGLAVVAGLIAGAVARLLYGLFIRARYRASLVESHERLPSRVVVQAYRFETTDEQPVYFALCNDTAVAHTDQDAIVDAVLDASRELFESGEVSPMTPRAFADDLFEYGIVDVEETELKLEQKVREETFGQLKDGEMVEQATLEEELEDYPDGVWEECLRRWRYRGELRLRNGYYLRVR